MNRKQFLGSLFTLPLAAKLLAKKAEAAHAEKKPIELQTYTLVSSSNAIFVQNSVNGIIGRAIDPAVAGESGRIRLL